MNNFQALWNDVSFAFDELKCKFPQTSFYLDGVWKTLNEKYAPHLQRHISKNSTKIEDIKGKLLSSMNISKFMFYGDIDKELCDDSPLKILESIKKLENAIGDNKRQIIYFSSLQGQLLRKLSRDDFDKVELSKSHKHFIMRLSRLTEKNNRLIYCELPLRFFRMNMKLIEEICETEMMKMETN